MLATLLSRLSNVRLRRASTELKPATELPSHLLPLFSAYGQKLGQLGFEPSHCQRGEDVFANDVFGRWSCVFLNRQLQTYAVVYPAQTPDIGNPAAVDFLTVFSDGRRLQTMNGLAHTILDSVPDTTINDPCADTLEQLWQSHQKALASQASGRTPIIVTPEDFVRRESDAKTGYVDRILRKGMLVPEGANLFRMRPLPMFRLAFKALGGLGKANKLAMKRVALARKTTPVELPPAVEIEGYKRAAQYERSRGRRWQGELLLFLGSLVFFVLSFGIVLTPEYLLILLMAISLHEVGHLFGMLLFRYEDVRLLFIPFFGAASIGTPMHVRPFQKVIVSLLGPLPGLLIGVVILGMPGAFRFEPVRDLALGLIGLNYLNLLPFMPFDGGHVFQNTLFLRYPLFQAIAWIGSGVIVGILALFGGEPFFIGIAAFLLFGALPQYRTSKAAHLLHRRLEGRDVSSLSEDEVLGEIYQVLRNPPYDGLTFAKKYQIAKTLKNSAGGGLPSFRAVAVALGLYALIFIVPFVVLGLHYTRAFLP